MAETDVYARILKLVAELSGESALHPQTRLKEDLALDSIELVQLVLRLNRAFGLQIHSAELLPENFGDIGRLNAFIQAKTAAHGSH